MKDIKINDRNLSEVLQEIEKAYYDIPFSNTKFQIDNFIVNQSITPERAYRTIGLQLITLIHNLEDMTLAMERTKIDIEEKEESLSKTADGSFEHRRLQIDMIALQRSVSRQEKNIHDTLSQIQIYHNYFDNMPKLTREQFEQAEEQYFAKNLHNQALGITGALESLISMGYTINKEGLLIKMPHNNLLEKTQS